MRKFHQSLLLVAMTLIGFRSLAQEALTIGTTHTIWSDTLSEERTYWIQLPTSYNDSPDQQYNLAIILDGNAHFIPAAGVFKFMARYNRIPETIVVGIQNVIRERDYTPDKIETVRKNSFGGADNFLYFLEKELIPELDKNYRTNGTKLLAGHSLGGLFATHSYMKPTSAFSHFIAIDPSLGFWDEPLMSKKVAAVTSSSFERKLYTASANSRTRRDRNEERHILLFKKLEALGQQKANAHLEYFENETHRTVPLLAWYHGLKFLFPQ